MQSLPVNGAEISEKMDEESIGLWELDLNTKMVKGDFMFCALLGIGKMEYSDKLEELYRLLPREEAARTIEAARESLAINGGKSLHIEFQAWRLNGERGCRVALFGIARHGYIYGGIRKMPDSRRFMDEIETAWRNKREFEHERNQAQILEDKLSTAEEASQQKSEFLAKMSHEIRTQMSALIGLLRLLLRLDLREREREYIERAEQSAKLLLKMTDNILDYSKIEAGKFVLENAELSIADVLSHVGKIMEIETREKKLNYKVSVQEGVPERLIGDSFKLNQVLVNLVSNAVKFTEKGDVSVSVSVLERVQERVTLQVSVSDTGIGMSPRQVGKLFVPFEQTDNSIARRFGGTGLGLAISKSIVEMMGGRIWCESTEGAGSTFYFTVCYTVA